MKSEYLQLVNTDKRLITQKHIEKLMSLAQKDDRVEHIKYEKDNLFAVKSDELDGIYSLGRIANSLYESEKDIIKRVKSYVEPDIINITEFKECPTEFFTKEVMLSIKTRKKLHEYALSLEPGSVRAECYTIASYKLEENETIADRFLRDHVSIPHAKRQARILVDIKRANEINRRKNHFGIIVFEDGSKL